MRMAQRAPDSPVTAPPSPTGHISVEMLTQYLDALLAGHKLPDSQQTEVNFALLHAIASSDTFLQNKAVQVLEQMEVMQRWKLARLIDEIAAPARPLVKEKFAEFMVGMLPDDFAEAETRAYAQGVRLFAAGDDAEEAFLVEEGTVLISKNGRKVTTCGKHEFFGNLPFLIPVKRTADAFALTPVKVRVLSRAAYLAKFRSYSPKRQADEFLLGYTMIGQLITGLARHESSVKVLVDYLFPDLTRHEQADALARWLEHFTSFRRYGLERNFALFNLLELLDTELLLLAHLDTADSAALKNIEAGKGILRGVAVTGLRTFASGLALLRHPPATHRLPNDFQRLPHLQAGTVDVVISADFLWPAAGNRRTTLTAADAQGLARALHPEGIVYFAGNPESPNLGALRQSGCYAGELTAGLYVLSPAGPPDDLPPPRPHTADTPRAASFFRRLGSLWRRG